MCIKTGQTVREWRGERRDARVNGWTAEEKDHFHLLCCRIDESALSFALADRVCGRVHYAHFVMQLYYAQTC